MRKLRVAHVITRLCRGGAQENTFHTVRLAARERYDVDLISGPTQGSEGSLEDTVREAGIDIIRVPGLVREPAPLRDWRALRHLTRLFREKRYDIVHTHTSKAGFLGREAAARAGVPVVVHTPHGHIFQGYFPASVTWFYTMLERRAARKSHKLIALTERGMAEHLAHGVGTPNQWVSIFSGIDLAPYDHAIANRDSTRRNLGIGPGDVLVGGVGRLEPVKGFKYFVEAALRVAEEVGAARFVHAGDGSLAAELAEQAAPLDNRFQFLGLRDDVPELMAAMDILVLPSLNEGMGRVLLECGAAGTPAIATAVGGVPDIIVDGETGVLVEPGDPEAIADALADLSRDSEKRRRMGANARKRIAPAYGLERMVKRIELLYEELVREHGLDA